MSEYAAVNKSRLKLKTSSSVKKKKKPKDKEKNIENIAMVEKYSHIKEASADSNPDADAVPLTKAEKAFLKMKKKKQMDQILEKAKKTHKQRVEEFNRHLDSLTEHYDIPKVSWTK